MIIKIYPEWPVLIEEESLLPHLYLYRLANGYNIEITDGDNLGSGNVGDGCGDGTASEFIYGFGARVGDGTGFAGVLFNKIDF
jgi:hypothetical protein